MKTRPDDFVRIPKAMTNFDHTIDEGMADDLKAGDFFGQHSAWNFYAEVFWKDGKFRSDVLSYGAIVGNHEADTLEDLMKIHNDAYGAD